MCNYRLTTYACNCTSTTFVFACRQFQAVLTRPSNGQFSRLQVSRGRYFLAVYYLLRCLYQNPITSSRVHVAVCPVACLPCCTKLESNADSQTSQGAPSSSTAAAAPLLHALTTVALVFSVQEVYGQWLRRGGSIGGQLVATPRYVQRFDVLTLSRWEYIGL